MLSCGCKKQHRDILDKAQLQKEANVPMVLEKKKKHGAGMEQVAAFYGYQEALQTADLAACKHSAPPCPSLTRNSIFVPPGTAFSRADPPQEQTPNTGASPASPALLFPLLRVFILFSGISPSSSHGSSPGGSKEDFQLLTVLPSWIHPALLC